MSMKAQQILDKYWDGSLPVDPAAIARRMGIRLLPQNDMAYDGHYVMDEESGQASIYYQVGVAPVRQRFTLAHELGHHAHGDINAPRDTRDNFSSRTNDYREVAANRFAASLIMPAEQVKLAVYERGITSISRLARLFDVSQVAMEFRLKNLGLL